MITLRPQPAGPTDEDVQHLLMRAQAGEEEGEQTQGRWVGCQPMVERRTSWTIDGVTLICPLRTRVRAVRKGEPHRPGHVDEGGTVGRLPGRYNDGPRSMSTRVCSPCRRVPCCVAMLHAATRVLTRIQVLCPDGGVVSFFTILARLAVT